MTEQNAAPPSEPGATLPHDHNEDAGRLTTASKGRLVAIVFMLTMLTEIIPLQVSMVSISLPKIGAAFPASGNSTSWAITILGVVGGATIALIGKAGDLYGKKRTLVVCGLLFMVGTLLCALTTSWPVFMVGRGIAAVSYGMNAVTYGIVRDIMPRRWIPVCVGILGAGLGMSGILGPVIGGALTDHFSWAAVFWFLIIYMAVMIPLFVFVVPESPVRVRQRFDLVGGLLLGAGVALVLIYLSEGGSWGWTNIGSIAYVLGGLLGLLAFVLWENRTRDPMMELSLLRAPKLSLLFITAFFITGFQALVNVVLSYMFQTPKAADLHQKVVEGISAQTHQPAAVLAPFVHLRGDLSYANGYSSLQLSVHVILWTALFTMVFGPVGGYIARRVGARVPLVVGTGALLAASALWINWHSTWQEQVSIGVLLGLGSGFYFAAWPNLVMDAVPVDRQGVSAGMFNVFGGVGTSVPVALMASIQAAHPMQMVISAPGSAPVVSNIPQVYTDSAYSQSYLLLGVIPCAIAFVIALIMRTGRHPARGGAPAAPAAPVISEPV